MRNVGILILVLLALAGGVSACVPGGIVATTSAPRPIPSPTPTPVTAVLLPTAGPLCETAFSSSVSSGPVLIPVLGLITILYEEDGWGLEALPHHQAQSTSEVQTLVCIRQFKIKTGTYTDGATAYSLKWEVRLANWPDGAVFGEAAFLGEGPPSPKTGSGDRYGSPPKGELLQWLIPILGDETILPNGGGVNSIAFSPDGRILAAGNSDRRVKLWDVATGQEVRTFSGHAGGVYGIVFAPDGMILASASWDKTVKLWDVATGQEMRTLSGHTEYVSSVVFAPDGKTLASGSRDTTVKLWNVVTGQ